jgi:hypothetical protein
LVSETLGHVENAAPKLVERHRELIRMLEPGPASRFLRLALHTSGVTESVLPPEQRPPAE